MYICLSLCRGASINGSKTAYKGVRNRYKTLKDYVSLSVFFCSKIFISSCFCFKTSSGATQNTSVKTFKTMCKSKNHQNPIYKFMRPIILYIDDSRCYFCNKQTIKNHVHHLDFNSKNNNAHNLITLCENHHKMTHSMGWHLEIEHDFLPLAEREKLNELITKIF